jgi:hypothetical protein
VSELPASNPNAAQSSTLEQLHETMDLVLADAARAQLWAIALSAFAQPVPEYDRVLVPVENWGQPQRA